MEGGGWGQSLTLVRPVGGRWSTVPRVLQCGLREQHEIRKSSKMTAKRLNETK